MPAPTRRYYTVVATSNMEDGTLVLSAHGHFRDFARARQAKDVLERAVAGAARVDIVSLEPPTATSVRFVHVIEDEL